MSSGSEYATCRVRHCTAVFSCSVSCCVAAQVDAADDVWGSGRSAVGSKMLLEDAEEDDLVVGLGAAAGAAAEFMGSVDAASATAMDATS